GGGRPGRLDGLLQPVERAGADIAVDNTECGKSRGCGLLPDALPGQPRGLKGLGHPDILPFGCESLHENRAGENLDQWYAPALPAWSDFRSCPLFRLKTSSQQSRLIGVTRTSRLRAP